MGSTSANIVSRTLYIHPHELLMYIRSGVCKVVSGTHKIYSLKPLMYIRLGLVDWKLRERATCGDCVKSLRSSYTGMYLQIWGYNLL